MFISTILTLLSIWAGTTTFVPDPSIRDPRRIWQIETEMPRNNLRSAMRLRGLAPASGDSETRAGRCAREVVVERLVERVNEAYGRRPSGAAIPRRSIDVTFFAVPPEEPRFSAGPGEAYSRICVGGAQTSCGGTLGVQYLDYGNRAVESECSPGRIGVFAGRICGLGSWLAPALEESEARFVDGRYRLGDGTRADDERFLEVRAALEDWGTALGNVTAHEIGHALGLEHDRGAGYIMEARISAEDLSSGALAMSPASLRSLRADVGIASAPESHAPEEVDPRAGGPHVRHVLESDRASTLGVLAENAKAIGVRDERGKLEQVLVGAAGDLTGRKLLDGAGAAAGLLFAVDDDGLASFVDADHPRVREALVARVRGHLARADARGGGGPTRVTGTPASEDLTFLAEGLSSEVPRIAGDAALDLLGALERAGKETPVNIAIRDRVAEALARNSAAFGDLRPLIRLAGRTSATSAVEDILAALAADSDVDLTAAAAEALFDLGARADLARRTATIAPGPGRSRLMRTLARMPAASISELETILAHGDRSAAEEAAKTLLRAGPVERERLFLAAKRLSPDRRAWVEALRGRPRS